VAVLQLHATGGGPGVHAIVVVVVVLVLVVVVVEGHDVSQSPSKSHVPVVQSGNSEVH